MVRADTVHVIGDLIGIVYLVLNGMKGRMVAAFDNPQVSKSVVSFYTAHDFLRIYEPFTLDTLVDPSRALWEDTIKAREVAKTLGATFKEGPEIEGLEGYPNIAYPSYV